MSVMQGPVAPKPVSVLFHDQTFTQCFVIKLLKTNLSYNFDIDSFYLGKYDLYFIRTVLLSLVHLHLLFYVYNRFLTKT